MTWIIQGDAGALPLEDESVDAIVTDPPYGLHFMQKKWDYDVPGVDTFAELLRVLKPGGRILCFAGTRTMHRMWVNIEDAGFTIEDTIAWMYGTGFPKHRSKLKPAYEPICVARKGPVTELNINECRVGEEARPVMKRTNTTVAPRAMSGKSTGATNSGEITTTGRWPANVVLDEDAAAALEEPSRFFYCAKASRKERNTGLDDLPKRPGDSNAKGFTEDVARGIDRNRLVANPHPTVKPIALMRWLCRLVTPPNGLVLDPFAGSGTTGIAAILEGFCFLGIEKEEEYCQISEARIAHWVQELTATAA